MSETANWKVVGYGGSGGILTEYTIENRTESEARSEAENDLLIILSDDWTMTKESVKCTTCGSDEGYTDSNCPNCGAILRSE